MNSSHEVLAKPALRRIQFVARRSNAYRRARNGLITLAAVLAAPCASAADKLFDWDINSLSKPLAIQNGGPYTPIGWAETTDAVPVITSNMQLGLPTGMQTRGWPFSNYQNLITTISSSGKRLDYLFSDYEGDVPQNYSDMSAVIQRIRSDASPLVNQARIGNYAFFPGRFSDPDYFHYPEAPNPEFQTYEEFYLSSGLNIAQPDLYPYDFYVDHTQLCWSNVGGRCFRAGVSPTHRGSMFWAPLELFSVAKRHLPAGHELIPYTNNYLNTNPGYGGTTYNPYVGGADQWPTLEDNGASIQHYRLRGADGVMTFLTNNSSDSEYTPYRQAVAAAWHGLDDLYNRTGSLRLLNAATNFSTQKKLGIDWSAAQKGNRVVALVSNLNTMSQSIDWSLMPIPFAEFAGTPASILSLPPNSPVVDSNIHSLLQYRSSYLEYSTFEANRNIDQSMIELGWKGPNQNAAHWKIAAPLGTGNPSTRVVMPTPDSDGVNTQAWFKMEKPPGLSAADKASYSAMFYFNNSTLRMFPFNSTGVSASDLPDYTQQGPRLSVDGFTGTWRLYFNKISIITPTLVANNQQFTAAHWYEARIDVDPTVSATGQARVYIRDVTRGDREFTLLTWDDLTTSDVTERQIDVTLELSSIRNPSNFDAWQISAYSAAVQFDNFNIGYAVPTADDNFEHYVTGSALNTQNWNGPEASGWEVRAPTGSGVNAASLVAAPIAGQWGVRAWWTTKSPAYEPSDIVVYSALLYGNNTGFSPVNTANANPNTIIDSSGPYFYVRSDSAPGFRLRGIMVQGDTYKSTMSPVSNHWYEVQLVVDQTRTIAGSPPGNYGVAKVYVRDATSNDSFQQLVFTNESTGDTTPRTELPLFLTNFSNPTTWNGWQVFGYDSSSQIDSLKTFLYPARNFAAGGAVGPKMVGPNP